MSAWNGAGTRLIYGGRSTLSYGKRNAVGSRQMNVCLRDVLGRCGATTPRQPSFPLYAFTHGRTTGVQYQVCCLLCASLADNDTTAIKISDHRAIQYASLCCGCKKYPPPICCQTCPHKTASLKTFDIYAPAVPYRSFCAAESLRANHILHNPQDGLGIKLYTPSSSKSATSCDSHTYESCALVAV